MHDEIRKEPPNPNPPDTKEVNKVYISTDRKMLMTYLKLRHGQYYLSNLNSTN